MHETVGTGAARLIAGGAATLSGSVLLDSAVEHYRGSFANTAMILPVGSAALSLVANAGLSASGQRTERVEGAIVSVHWASAATGLAGLGFHVYNVLRQPGGLSYNSLFYRAPIGAPLALTLGAVLGRSAQLIQRGETHFGPFPLLSGRLLAGFIAFGLVGTVLEAGLLHFRGAFHNPAMWLPLALPPAAAAALARDALFGSVMRITGPLLAVTAALGIAGVAFHAYGVSRNMGGWRNWRQNLLAGPPLPAPPSFTGLAIAGLGALLLIRRSARG
jgi:hypothetical protein